MFGTDRSGRGWKLNTRTISDTCSAIQRALECDVLIMTTGNFATPYMPNIDMSLFEGLVLHVKDLHNATMIYYPTVLKLSQSLEETNHHSKLPVLV